MGTPPVFIALAQNGDERAWHSLARRYQDAVLAHALGRLGELEPAREAALATFVQGLGRIEEVRDAERFAPWLRRVCDGCSPPVADPVHASGATARLLALPREEERLVAFQHYLAQVPPADIAQFLGIPLATVQNRLVAVARRLKKRGSRETQAELARERPSLSTRFVDDLRDRLGREARLPAPPGAVRPPRASDP